MPRIRSVKPEFWDSPGTVRASLRARLLYIAMWNWADDYGIGDGNLNRLVSFAFPGDHVPASDFPKLASEVSDCFGVVFYEHAGRPYFHIPTWEKHQRTEKKARQHVPFPNETSRPADPHDSAEVDPAPSSVGDSAASDGSTGPGTGEQGEVGTGEQGNKGTAPRKRGTRIPDPFIVTADMRQWAALEAPAVDVDRTTARFVNYWRAKTGRDATKLDWLATWRNWLMTDNDRTRGGIPAPARESSIDRVQRQHAETRAQLAREEANHDTDRGTRLALDAGDLRQA